MDIGKCNIIRNSVHCGLLTTCRICNNVFVLDLIIFDNAHLTELMHTHGQ